MPTKFTVQHVADVSEFESRNGPMYGFRLDCVNHDTGGVEVLEINAKTADRYKVGAEFFGEPTGKEFKGIKKYKAVVPMNNVAAPAGNAPTHAPGALISVAPPKPKPMSYEDASGLIKRLLDDFGQVPEAFVVVFEAILSGKVENPVRPRTVVKYFNNEIETAGVEQAAWDEMDVLCNRLEAETDKPHVRALLIATTAVQTRKDLTADKANLFIAALRSNLAVIEANKPKLVIVDSAEEEIPF